MNILIVHNKYKIRGGEDVVVENEAKLLKEMGVSVFEYIRSNDEIDKLSLWQKLLLPINTIFSHKTYREIKQIIVDNRIDVIQVHNFFAMISPSVYYAGLKKGIPVFQTLHNYRLLCPNALFLRNGRICEECLSHSLLSSIQYKCYRDSVSQTLIITIMLYVHRVLGTFNRINYICLSEYNKDKFLRLNKKIGVKIEPNQVYVKPNFVEDYGYYCEEHDNYFLYVGRLSTEKGIINLLEAWKEYEIVGNKEKLIICGDGPEKDRVQQLCINLNFAEYIGKIPHDLVLKYMSKAKALIVPSICYESGPLSVIEAYSVGCPVLGSNIGNVNEIIISNVTGMRFNPNDVHSVVNTIISFNKLNNKQLRSNAYNYYKSVFSKNQNMEIFNVILQNNRNNDSV